MRKCFAVIALLTMLLLTIGFAPSLAYAGDLYDDGVVVIDDDAIYPKTDGVTELGESGNEWEDIHTDSITLGGVANTSWSILCDSSGDTIVTAGTLGICVIGKVSLTDNIYAGGDLYLNGGDIIYGSTTKMSFSDSGLCFIGSISNTGNLYIGGYVYAAGMKSGTDQSDAGAAAGELYYDTNDDDTVKMGT